MNNAIHYKNELNKNNLHPLFLVVDSHLNLMLKIHPILLFHQSSNPYNPKPPMCQKEM